MIGNRQPITTTLVAMSVAVFVAMALTGVSPLAPTIPQLLKWGANWGPLSLGAEPWRMLASNYVHGGIIHIALNMWCLWNLGLLAERVFDPWTYVLTYTFCGLAGSLASLWWHPMAVGVGASGAIFGLAGALIAALYRAICRFPSRQYKAHLEACSPSPGTTCSSVRWPAGSITRLILAGCWRAWPWGRSWQNISWPRRKSAMGGVVACSSQPQWYRFSVHGSEAC